MRSLIKIIIILFIFSSIIGYIYYSNSRKPLLVEVNNIEKGDIILSISASGEIKSENEADLKFSSTGRITFLPHKVSDNVLKEDLLASIDGTQTLKNLETAKIDKQKAIDLADEIRETYEGNIDEGPGFYKLKQAEKAVEQAEHQISIYENALYNLSIYAPFSGTLTEITKKEGEIANILDTKPLIKLVDLNNLYFEAAVDEADIGKVNNYQKVNIKLDAYPKKILQGEVIKIETTTSLDASGNKVIETKIKLKRREDVTFRVGLSGDAEIIQQIKPNVLIIPIETIFKEKGKNYVYVLAHDYAIKQEITLGLENDDYIEVLSGLNLSDKVIISDIEKIKEGKKIIVDVN